MNNQAPFRSLSLERIRADHEIQCRVNIDEATVADYQHDIQAGVKLPPIDVFFDGVNANTGGNHWLADGFHRYLAHQRGGLARIACRVHRGTREDALWYAIGANKAHGLRRSNDDKRKAVKAALLHPEGAKMSDRQIAEYVGVAPDTVNRYRRAMEAEGSLSESDTRTGRDGRTIDTANIGRKQKSADEPEQLRVYTAEEIEQMRQEAAARGCAPADLGPKCFDQDEEPDDNPVACPECGCTEHDEDETGRFCRKCRVALGEHEPVEIDEDQDHRPKVRGVGIQRAHEAIASLKQIPINDALRNRAFQIVADWIMHNGQKPPATTELGGDT